MGNLPVPVTDRDKKAADRKISELFRRAEQGDKTAIAAVREAYKDKPAFWDALGDMARTAESAVMTAAIGENGLTRLAMEQKLAALKKELAGPAPTPLEKLLVDRIAICWLQVGHADAAYAQNMTGISLRMADYYQQRQDRAQRRYLEAIRALAQVRRLQLPMVQVNIAEQQVNVAG